MGTRFIDKFRRIISFLCKAFYGILAVCPFLLGSIYALVNLTGGWGRVSESHDKTFYRMPEFNNVLLSFVFILVILGIVAWICEAIIVLCQNVGNVKKRCAVIASILFFITVILRLVPEIIFAGGIHPFSDFAHAWSRANGDMSSVGYYQFFASHMNYSLFLKLISKISGGHYSGVIVFDIICNGITAVFVFLAAKEVSSKERSAVIASLLFAFTPSSIVYALTSTPEHMAIACYGCAVWLICKMMKEVNYKKILLYGVCCGVVCGIGNSVKTFFPVIMIAFAIIFILKTLYEWNTQQYSLNKISIYILSFMLMATAQSVVLMSITSMTEYVFDVQLDFSDATPHYINVGLNRQGEGQIGVGNLSRLYIQDRQDGITLEEAVEAAQKRLKDDWAGHESELFSFLIKKTIWAWQDDVVPIRYFCQRLGIEPSTTIEKMVYSYAENYLYTVSQLWYVIIMLTGLFCSVRRIKASLAVNWLILLDSMIIMGYVCLVMLSEAQSRYKCLVLPYICIFISCGIYEVIENRASE